MELKKNNILTDGTAELDPNAVFNSMVDYYKPTIKFADDIEDPHQIGDSTIIDWLNQPRDSEEIKQDTTEFKASLSDNGKKAFQFLKDKGLSDVHSAAIVGNLMRESSSKVNPLAWNPNDNGSPSGGIAQWHGVRLQKLMQQKNWKSLDAQLNYLWDELNSNYKKVLDKLKQTSNLEDASYVILNEYEVPQDRVRGGKNHRTSINYSKMLLV